MSRVTPLYLAQQIIRLVESGDQSRDSQLTEREVVPLVVNVANKVLKAEMYRMRQDDNGSKTMAGHFVRTFRNVPVKELVKGGENFIDLPADYAMLPYNEGVRRIAPYAPDNALISNKAMIPVQHEEMDILGDIIGNMQKQFIYYVEGDKAYFYKRCGKSLCEEGIKYVSVSLVVVLGDVDENTPLQAPPELRIDIITGVLDILQATYGIDQVKDSVNDNNPDNA